MLDQRYKDEIDALRQAGRLVCEFTKLAIDQDSHSQRVLAALFHLAYIYAHKLHDATDLVIEVNPRHAVFYKRMLGFTKLGEERQCPRVNAPAILLRLTCEYVTENTAKYGGAMREADLEQALHSGIGRSRYEALVCLSGGKDSLNLLYRVKVDYGLNVLAYTTDVNIPEAAWDNIRRTVEKLGVDHLVYRPPTEFYRKIFRHLLKNQNASCVATKLPQSTPAYGRHGNPKSWHIFAVSISVTRQAAPQQKRGALSTQFPMSTHRCSKGMPSPLPWKKHSPCARGLFAGPARTRTYGLRILARDDRRYRLDTPGVA